MTLWRRGVSYAARPIPLPLSPTSHSSNQVGTRRVLGPPASIPPLNSAGTLLSTASGPVARPQSSMSASPTRMPHRIATRPRKKSSSDTRRKSGQIRRPLHHQTPFLHPPCVLCGWDAWRGGYRCFAAASLQPCSQMEAVVLRIVCFVRSRLSIALVRSASRCLRADRNPPRRSHAPMWDSRTGLGLYRL